MDKNNALISLSALAQETRLDVFRLLVKAGETGMFAGEIADRLGIRQNSLSSNLAILVQAGLLKNRREGRSIRFFANMEGMHALLSFLLEDCCGGKPEHCRQLLNDLKCAC